MQHARAEAELRPSRAPARADHAANGERRLADGDLIADLARRSPSAARAARATPWSCEQRVRVATGRPAAQRCRRAETPPAPRAAPPSSRTGLRPVRRPDHRRRLDRLGALGRAGVGKAPVDGLRAPRRSSRGWSRSATSAAISALASVPKTPRTLWITDRSATIARDADGDADEEEEEAPSDARVSRTAIRRTNIIAAAHSG